MDNKQKIYGLGEFAALLNVSSSTVQRWDREGVLVARRTLTNRRYYTYEDYTACLSGKINGAKISEKEKKEKAFLSKTAIKKVLTQQIKELSKQTKDRAVLKKLEKVKKVVSDI